MELIFLHVIEKKTFIRGQNHRIIVDLTENPEGFLLRDKGRNSVQVVNLNSQQEHKRTQVEVKNHVT